MTVYYSRAQRSQNSSEYKVNIETMHCYVYKRFCLSSCCVQIPKWHGFLDCLLLTGPSSFSTFYVMLSFINITMHGFYIYLVFKAKIVSDFSAYPMNLMYTFSLLPLS
jgi:hypothetical protein